MNTLTFLTPWTPSAEIETNDKVSKTVMFGLDISRDVNIEIRIFGDYIYSNPLHDYLGSVEFKDITELQSLLKRDDLIEKALDLTHSAFRKKEDCIQIPPKLNRRILKHLLTDEERLDLNDL